MKLLQLLGFALALTMGFMVPVSAQSYANKVIKIVIPFPAGGGTDPFARSICDVLTSQLKQPCIVESKPGAGTAIGNAFVSRSAPDGHTLLLNTSAFSIVPAISRNVGYEGVDAFSPVALVGETTSVIVVKSDSRYKSIKDWLAAVRLQPGKLHYASSGVGTTTHLTGELLASEAGLDLTHVPYRGAGLLINDIIGGQVEVGFSSLTSAMPFLADGRVRAIAVTTLQRSPRLPDVPTLAESGVQGFDVPVWYGVFAPPGTPKPIVDTLNKALTLLPEDSRFVQWASREGVTFVHSTPQQLGDRARADEKRWRQLAKEKNIRSD